MKVEIDSQSGFCGGVIRAISMAGKYLEEHGRLYSLGSIVHNEAELARLEAAGLITMDKEDLEQMSPVSGETLLIRAHGEPPEVYEKIRSLGFSIVDCTCPVVLKLQKEIKDAYLRLHSGSVQGQLVIFGKIGHAEVLGLVGQVGGDAVVVENLDQVQALVDRGVIRTDRPVELFSQTTMGPAGYEGLVGFLKGRMADPSLLSVHHTICAQVASRHDVLTSFAMSHDIIIFVSGRASSNGKVLCQLCRNCNIRTCHIGSPKEIRREWFRPDDRVGVCGATSTPRWLLEEVASTIENLQ